MGERSNLPLEVHGMMGERVLYILKGRGRVQTDRRVKRTQNLLAKALIALTLEKGYEVVTIRDITERADVGYATFFRHYHSKDELLQDVSEVVIEELTDLLFAAPAGDP
jgi:AcrR family transcriptional regulator